MRVFLFSFLTVCLLATMMNPSVAQPTFKKKGKVRAVVIGVSKYMDPNMRQLSFAHRDAQTFASYLQSEAGGSVPPSDIRLLVNEDATGARIVAAMDWLLAESKKGDKVFIYYAGHGDVETVTDFESGFLLPYDCLANNYEEGGYPLTFLHEIVVQLANREVRTFVVMDACRAGKLAGSAIGGPRLTTEAWLKLQNNAIKIMSCHPDESSMESRDWGGGRGVFSYFFTEGLLGFADEDGDLRIILEEVEDWVEDNVKAVTERKQRPMVEGDEDVLVSLVIDSVFQKIKTASPDRTEGLLALNPVVNRGLEPLILPQLDSIVRQRYLTFEFLLREGPLMGPGSAVSLYDELIEEPALAPLRDQMRRNLAAALQDDAQRALFGYLKADSAELNRRIRTQAFGKQRSTLDNQSDTSYFLHPLYLQKAAELLGPKHYAYDHIIAKKLYFDGVLKRLNASRIEHPDTIYRKLLLQQHRALRRIPKGAFIMNEIALLHAHLSQLDSAIYYYRQAQHFAPTWAIPFSNISGAYIRMEKLDSARISLEDGIALDSNFYGLYLNLGAVYLKQENMLNAIPCMLSAIEKQNHHYLPFYQLGQVYLKMFDYELAEIFFEEAEKRKGGIVLKTYDGGMGMDLEEPFVASPTTSGSGLTMVPPLPLNPNDAARYLDIARVYATLEQKDSAEYFYKKVLTIEPHWKEPYNWLARELKYQGRWGEAAYYALTIAALYPDDYNADWFIRDWGRLEMLKHTLLNRMKNRPVKSREWYEAFNDLEYFVFAPEKQYLELQHLFLKYNFSFQQYNSSYVHDINPAVWRYRYFPERSIPLFKMALKKEKDAVALSGIHRKIGLVHADIAWQHHEDRLYFYKKRLITGEAGYSEFLEEALAAISHLAKAEKLKEGQAGMVWELNRLLLELKNYPAAWEYLQTLQTGNQINNELRPAYARLLSAAGMADSAKAVLNTALANQIDTSMELRHALAEWQITNRDTDAAIQTCEAIIALDSDSADRYYNLACLHAQRGDTTAALRWLEVAMQKSFRHRLVFKYDPNLAALRDTPAFAALIRKYTEPYDSFFDTWLQ